MILHVKIWAEIFWNTARERKKERKKERVKPETDFILFY